MKDEVLSKRFVTDQDVTPYYEILDQNGNVLMEDVIIAITNNVLTAGTPLNKSTLLTDQTAGIIWAGNPPSNPTVDDALYQLATGDPGIVRYVYQCNVTLNGVAAPNIPVTGLTDLATGNTAVTDAYGVCIGYATQKTTTLSVGNNWLDINNWSGTYTHDGLKLKAITIPLTTSATSPYEITSTRTIKFSPRVKTAQFFAVGGGGCGGQETDGNYGCGATGGAGGFTATSSVITLAPNDTFVATIGAGQAGGSTANASAGTTTVKKSTTTIITAAGGQNGSTMSGVSGYDSLVGASGGSGSSAVGINYSSRAIIVGQPGGSDGGDGDDIGSIFDTDGGTGQGTTTRAFGESAGTMYAGAGGGAAWDGRDNFGMAGAPGTGGGVAGGPTSGDDFVSTTGQAGQTYGSGGGAGVAGVAGAGANGVVIVRWTV